jgi:hypothetical protein
VEKMAVTDVEMTMKKKVVDDDDDDAFPLLLRTTPRPQSGPAQLPCHSISKPPDWWSSYKEKKKWW